MSKESCFCIKPVSAALTMGGLWSVVIFIWTLVAMQNGFGSEGLAVFQSIYPGHELSVLGAFVGALWAFVDVSLGVWVLLTVYLWLKAKLNK